MAPTLVFAALTSLAVLANADLEEDAQRARCVVNGKTLKMGGDSNTRFHSFNVADLLIKGTNEDTTYNDNGPDGKFQGAYWTEDWGRSSRGTHIQGSTETDASSDKVKDGNGMCQKWSGKDINGKSTSGEVCFDFMQSIWYDRGGDPNMKQLVEEWVKDDHNIVVYNGCWWDLKDWSGDETRDYDRCGAKMDSSGKDPECEKLFKEDYESVNEALFKGRVSAYRSSSFGGDYASSRTESGKPIEKCNAIAEDVFGDKYVEIYENWKGELKENTVDGTHATHENYQKWTMAVMKNLDKQLGTGCFGDSPSPRPAPSPPSPRPPSPRPAPSPRPPSPACKKDNKKWYAGKKGKKQNCKWVRTECKGPEKKCKKACKKKGRIGGKGKKIKATEACCKTCADYA